MPKKSIAADVELAQLQAEKIGRLTVLRLTPASYHVIASKRKYSCRCDCGNVKDVRVDHLRTRMIVSCGCYMRQRQSEGQLKHGHSIKSDNDGKVGSRTYRCWLHMRRRCYNPNVPAYKDYGAKGIAVCDRWLGGAGFENFLKDMGECPSDKHTLDRFPNRKGSYEPGNARWATMTEQNRNRDFGRVTINGVSKPLVEWCEIYDQDYKFAHGKIAKGIDPLTALTMTPQHGVKNGFRGTTK